MEAFPVDIDVSSPSASVFEALCTLSPPSPILTPSQLTFAWSSGDIPILLYDEGYAECSSDQVSNSLISCTRKRDSTTSQGYFSAPATAQRDRISFGRNSIPSVSSIESGLAISESLESSTTLTSVGTFGPRHRKRTLRTSLDSQYSSAASQSNHQPSSNPRLSGDDEKIIHDSFRRTRISSHAQSKIFYHPIVFVDVNQAPSQNAEKGDTLNSAKPELLEATDGAEDDTSPISTKVHAKPISWISSRSWDYAQYKEFAANQDTFCHPPSMQIISESNRTAEALLLNRLSNSESHTYDEETHACEPPQELHQDQHDHNHGREQSVRRRSVKLPPPVPFFKQQLEHDWLEDVYVEFLIDQEGFRAARPFFRFAGIVRHRSSSQVRAPGDVMAQFKPIVRQASHFHYAPFETPPILRRITVNGDDTHDYVSRQGLLSLKANGVYVLHGQELPAGSYHHHESDLVKLHWQFEYLVDDRVADSSGRVMVGEKTLTPLTFSCSPALLLPTQARKNNIMHVFKKGVAPKLHSEKLQPPGTLGPTGSGFEPSSLAPSTHLPFSSKAQGQSSHRRGKSHGIRYTDLSPMIKGSDPRPHPLGDGDGLVSKMKGDEPINLLAHRRRNSSAGEHNDSPIRLHFNTMGHSTHKDHRGEIVKTAHNAQPSIRHIIPPAKLAKLLDIVVEKENLRVHQPTAPRPDSNNFVPLAPRPRQQLKR